MRLKQKSGRRRVLYNSRYLRKEVKLEKTNKSLQNTEKNQYHTGVLKNSHHSLFIACDDL